MTKGGRSKASSNVYSSYRKPFHEEPAFCYLILILVIAILVVSSLALYNIYQLKQFLIPTKINTKDLLAKLTSHNEMENYVGVSPLNIVQINNNNLANLQTQISSLDYSNIGDFIVQYTDELLIYDYNNDIIKETINLKQKAKLPDDFFTKLNAHPELQGLENEQPTGGQLDEASLAALKQQFPDVYTNAKVGDFLLRYQTKLIIYDYNQDKIVNTINLG